jgi:signal transduction histidine kinase
MSLIAPESVEILKGAFAMHQRGEDMCPYEYRLITKDGRRIDSKINTKLICYGGEKALLGVITDISELKKKERELEESQRKLEDINEKLRVVGGLTRHDVKNKLMVANANLYLLKKKIGTQPELAKYVEGIETAIKQSDKLFDFSRLYEQIGIEKPTEINVADCFDQAALLLVDQELKIRNECQDLTVTAGPMLRQLFYNLIDNSVKHGKTVTEIRLHYTKDSAGTELFYEDNGVGIPEADKEKIFTEGFTTGNGTGLGLKLVQKMIEAYGWTIKESGIPGKGAVFQIVMPTEKAVSNDENMFVLSNLESKLISKTK